MHRAILLLLIIAAPLSATAQLGVGVHGLVNRIALAGDVPSGGSWAPELRIGAGATVSVDVASDITLFLQGELDNRRTALQYAIPLDNEALFSKDTTVDSAYVTTTWLSIPVGVRIYSMNRRWYFSTGLTTSFLSSIEVDTLTGSYEPTGAIARFDVGVFLGGAYSVDLDPLDLVIEVRYLQGIADLIGEVDDPAFRSSPIIRMSGLQARVAAEWRFDL
jgi:hypothetical protein